MDREDYIWQVGQEPVQDDLERVNCPDAGKVGHRDCGWCQCQNRPVFMGGCSKSLNDGKCTK